MKQGFEKGVAQQWGSKPAAGDSTTTASAGRARASSVSTRGGGVVAGLCAQLDAEGREEKADERAAVLAARAGGEALDELLDAIGAALKSAASCEMIAAGCHNHKGEWRVIRGGKG